MKRYVIRGQNICVFALCKFISDEKAIETIARTQGSIYAYEKTDTGIILYELPADILREIKEIENYERYKIVPYQSCVLHSISEKFFVLFDSEGDEVIFSGYSPTRITQPARVKSVDFEKQKEMVLQIMKNTLGVENIKEIQDAKIHWDTKVEFLLPEILQYREKIKNIQQRKIVLSINLALIILGLYFLVVSFFEKQNIDKEYSKVQSEYLQLGLKRQKIISNRYLDRIKEIDFSQSFFDFVQEIMSFTRSIPDCNIDKIEFDNAEKTIKAIITTTKYQNKIKQKYPECKVVFSQEKVSYEIKKEMPNGNIKVASTQD
ncbi:MAG: hypothetical protein QXV73_04415 [Candidatus Micrarchaeia archaeon]